MIVTGCFLLGSADKERECCFSVAAILMKRLCCIGESLILLMKKGLKKFSHSIGQKKKRNWTAVKCGKLAGSLWVDLDFKKTRDRGYNTWNLFMR